MTRKPKCRFCKKPSESPLHDACVEPWYEANREKLRAKARKVDRAETRKKLEKLERLPSLKAKAQRAFNNWIRERDHDKPCISCGAPAPDLSGFHAGRDAGHYRSVGAASHLRFHEDNCHAQCVHCNQWKAGKAVDYRIGLVARVGAAAVEALEADKEPRKWTHDELRAIAATYRQKLKDLKAKAE
jgi:hypothetical protein